MRPIRLTTVTRTQGNNADLKDGTVTPRGFAFDFEEVPVLVHAFRRMVRGLEFDVAEMAFTTYLCAKEHGTPFTALPVFLVRAFHHGAIMHNVRAGIRGVGDLEGAQVGVNRGYTVTTGVWARGILTDEYGLDPDRVTWLCSGDEHVAEYQRPANVMPLGDDRDLARLLASGELPAAIGVDPGHPDVVPLIADPTTAALTALVERGVYPINHLVVVRDELLDAHPDLAVAVFSAFAEAKGRYVERLRQGRIAEPTPADRTYLQVMDATGADPLPYGIAANRAVIDMLIDHALRQRILTRRPDVDRLFAPGTHDLTA